MQFFQRLESIVWLRFFSIQLQIAFTLSTIRILYISPVKCTIYRMETITVTRTAFRANMKNYLERVAEGQLRIRLMAGYGYPWTGKYHVMIVRPDEVSER